MQTILSLRAHVPQVYGSRAIVQTLQRLWRSPEAFSFDSENDLYSPELVIADEHLIADIAAAQSHQHPFVIDQMLATGCWTFGRAEGMPWARIDFDETSEQVTLWIRHGGGWQDPEDPPRYMSCKVFDGPPYDYISDCVSGSERMDLWWNFIGLSEIDARLVVWKSTSSIDRSASGV